MVRLLDVVFDEERLRRASVRNAGRSARAAHLSHGRRVGQPGGLDDDVVEGRGTLHPLAQDAHEIATHCAADAAVVHLDHVLPGLH